VKGKMKHRSRILAFGCCMLALACADDVPLLGRPCPCAPGWICCNGRNICVPDGEFCPTAEQGTPCPCESGFVCCQASQICIPDGQSCAVPAEPEITHHPSRGPRVACAETETDEQPDGTTVLVNWSYIHDLWGNVTEMLGDHGGDQTIDFESRWFYDIYGNPTGREEYANGLLRFKRSTAYDPYGRVTTREIDGDGDGLIDQRDTWDYHGRDPVRTTQTFLAASLLGTQRCTYTLREGGQPTAYSCVSLPDGTPGERAQYSDAIDRRIVQIATDGVHYDHEIDLIRAAGLVEIDHYDLPAGMPRVLVQHFVVDAPDGTPSAWDLRDQTRTDFPHSTGTYSYECP
jgi:hypothetical protein